MTTMLNMKVVLIQADKCDVEGCEQLYNWHDSTFERVETFLTALVEAHKKLDHNREQRRAT